MEIGEPVLSLFLDFDGTMVDSLKGLYALYQEILHQFGKKGSEEEFHSLSGATIEEISFFLAKKHAISKKECLESYNKELKNFYKEQVKPFPGLGKALTAFHAMGLQVFIVTSCPKQYVEAFFSSYPALFLKISGIHTPKIGDKGKPHPDLYLHALEKFHCKPESTAVIEDSLNGILAAKTAGMRVIFFEEKKGWKTIVDRVRSYG